jgi:DNA-binding transcriptional LysR family regulator
VRQTRIANLLRIVAAHAVAQGRLIPILADWTVRSVEVSALYPSRLGASRALREFVDFLTEHWQTVATE